MYFAIEEYKNLLTIEDFISVHGFEWGFSEKVVQAASERVELFDKVANTKRYS